VSSDRLPAGHLCHPVDPLAKDLPWAKSLDVSGAVRYTDYSTSGFKLA
jgi:hypothetical protein